MLKISYSTLVASQGIAADITEIDPDQNVFFIVYDPERKIPCEKNQRIPAFFYYSAFPCLTKRKERI